MNSSRQWDINQTLAINDWAYDELPMVHFCNIKSDTAICVQGERSEALEQQGIMNLITVKIPNKLLQEPYNIIAYVYLTTESLSSVNSRTIYKIEIPVEKRVKPSDYIYSDEWADEIYNCGVSYDSTTKTLKVNGGETITQIKLSSVPQEQDDVVNKAYVDSEVEAAKGVLEDEITNVENNIRIAEDDIREDISDLKGYIGYTDDDIYGVEVDYDTGAVTRVTPVQSNLILRGLNSGIAQLSRDKPIL